MRILNIYLPTLMILCLITLFVVFAPEHCQESMNTSQKVDTTSQSVGEVENIILIVVDTLRTSELGFMGCDRSTSPNLDALAAESVVFTQAYTPQSLTGPAFTSLFTGKHPLNHGVMELYQAWKEGEHSLIADFQSAGWNTLGWYATNVIEPGLGFGQGFDSYSRNERDESQTINTLREAMTNLRWGRQIDNRPRFVMIHLWDTHSPYLPEDRDLESLSLPVTYDGVMTGEGELIAAFEKGEVLFTMEDMIRTRQLYDAEVHGLDRHLGWFFDQLREEGFYDNSLIVFTADHGEALGYDRRLTHGRGMEHELHIPLLMRFPEGWHWEIDVLTEITDILPIIASHTGVALPIGIDGIPILLHSETVITWEPQHDYLLSIDGWKQGRRMYNIYDGDRRYWVDIPPVDVIDYFEVDLTPEQLATLEALGYVN